MVREVKPSVELIETRFTDTKIAFEISPVAKPKAVIIAGVSGSGKSTLIRQFHREVKNYFPIQADDYRRSHPKIQQFLEKYGREEAHKKTGNFSHRMATALLEMACEQQCNIVYETTFNRIETANNLLDVFKQHHYEIIIIALPANVELSIERNKQRFEDKLILDNTLPRIVEKEIIEQMAINYQDCISQLKNDRLISLYEVSNSQMALETLSKIL